MLSIKNSIGGGNEIPKISNLVTIKREKDNFTISYKITDIELSICRQYISLKTSNNVIFNKKEITKDVGYESENNIFTFNINGLSRDTAYTVEIFASDGIDEGKSEALQVSTTNPNIYELNINENNANSFTSVTYGGDATGFTPAEGTNLGDWENKWPFNQIRIVGFKDGKVTKEIKKDNKKQYVDGNSVNEDVDVMVEIPRIYYKFTTQTNGYKITISDETIKDGACFAHRRGTKENDYIYIGAYLGSKDSEGNLRSLPDKNMINSDQIPVSKMKPGYEKEYFYLWNLKHILFMLAYKCRNGQLVLGKSSTSSYRNTGVLADKGYIYGSEKTRKQFLGIEDFYGLNSTIVYGIWCRDAIVRICKNNANLKDINSYAQVGKLFYQNTHTPGFFNKMQATNVLQFLPKLASLNIQGTDTNHYGATFYPPATGYYFEWFHNNDGNRATDETGMFEMGFTQDEREPTRLCYLGV